MLRRGKTVSIPLALLLGHATPRLKISGKKPCLGVAVLVVAAGKGERAGGVVPKQYAPLLGTPILRWTLDAFARHPRVGRDPGGHRPGQEETYASAVAGLDLLPVVVGGATRQESVATGAGSAGWRGAPISS